MSEAGWLAALAAHGLPGAPTLASLPAIDETIRVAAAHKLLGVLAAAVADEAIELDDAALAAVAAAHEDAMREVLLLEEELLGAVAVLDEAGIESRVLKGAALAHTVHPDPAERCFGDNDVLVASDDIDAAVGALLEAGATRPVAPLSPSFDRRFAKSVTLGWHAATELDLHRTLAPGPYGFLIRLDELMSDPVELALAGRSVRTLSPTLHLLHAAIHVALGDVEPRLGNVRDVALLLACAEVRTAEVIDAAERWGCVAPVAIGLRATAALGLPQADLARWADEVVLTRDDQRLLASYAQREGRFRRQARASWSVLGWRDRPAFAAALLRSSAASRASREPRRER